MPILEYVLHAWSDGAMAIDKNGDTALHNLLFDSNTIPLATVKLIVEVWPGAVKVQNRYNNLPLHITLFEYRSEHYNIIEYLVNIWPAAIEVRGEEGWLPVDLITAPSLHDQQGVHQPKHYVS